MPITFSSENPRSLPTLVTISIPYIDPSQSPKIKTSRFPPVVLSVYPSSDTRSAPSYVPSVNPSRSPNKQHIGALQEEIQTTLEQVKALENIITSQEIKLDETDQLRGLYIIKLKRGICMFDTNEHNFSEEKNLPHTFKKKPKERIPENKSKTTQ